MRGRSALVPGALAALLTLTGCGDGAAAGPAGRGSAAPSTTTDPSPPEVAPSQLTGEVLWTNPDGAVPRALAQARQGGAADDVAVLEALDRPTATWFAGQQDDPTAAARQITEDAAARGETPVLVLYNIPGRDCGLASAGGAPDAEAYQAWVGRIGSGLGDRPAVVVLEPDAVPQALVGCDGLDDVAARHRLLSQAVDILRKQPGTRVYLDAGNSSWVQELDVLAADLRASGLGNAHGFSLNVSNFEATEATAEYGQRLSELTDGARFVIDTSRNGAGPADEDGSGLEWCNPRDRLLGQTPTTDPGIAGVDALLWVKQPGDSDGDCRPGELPAGTFSLDLARDLAG